MNSSKVKRSPHVATRSDPCVTEISANDVQLGRGRPISTSEGNVRFRRLVLDNKARYASSKRHAQKAGIAHSIVRTIAERGGHFLRKLDAAAERQRMGIADGAQAWTIVDEETSLEKVKQALRDQDSALSRPATLVSEGKSPPAGRKRKDSVVHGTFPLTVSGLRVAANKRSERAAAAQSNRPFGCSVAAASAAPLPEILPGPESEPSVTTTEETVVHDGHDLSYSLKHPSLRKRDLLRLRREQQAAFPCRGRVLESSHLTESGPLGKRNAAHPSDKTVESHQAGRDTADF
jgi:hypothetical protein